ncbi:MAG: glutamate-5-semialdehyde dehydrogenase [Clostridia bacterium]|nr:glutamate-5-semialdehyde dehydrogenase [Clostridia bacterium]
MTTNEILIAAKNDVLAASLLSTEKKNEALINMADALVENCEEILKANEIDVSEATHLSKVMIDRLMLTKDRIVSMADGIRDVAKLDDPVGKVYDEVITQKGLKVQKVSVPFGVIAVIFESRPNVSSDTAALTLKSGNVCVLRCGQDSYNSCKAIVKALKSGLRKTGVSENLINIVDDKTRASAECLMTANDYVDLLIPRGGKNLIKNCVENATVPCIETGTGICHIYVDESANLEMATSIIENAKTSRPSVCNAEEVLLVNRKIKDTFLPMLKGKLVDARINSNVIPVELRCDEEAYEIVGGTRANAMDFDTEFLDYILAVKIVENVDEAIMHIAKHSTHHSEAIITENSDNASKFTRAVDSAAVYVNASTRFTDGGEFGKGCEIGISTQKLHARGPMGLSELNTYKYIIYGNGQIR